MYPTIRTVCVSLGLFLSTLPAYLRAEFPQQVSGQENVLERFKVSREDDSLMVPVRVKGKDYHFLLDTASTISIYDESFRSVLGAPLRLDNISLKVHTYAGEKRGVSLFRPPNAKLGNIELPLDRPVLCIDFAKWRKLTKEEIYGAIGMDFLREHVVRIDFDRGEVTFLRCVGRDAGTHVPFSSYHNIPQVEVTIPGVQMREKFLVDTGLLGESSGELREELFDELAKRGLLTPARVRKFESVIGPGSDKNGFVEEIAVGNYGHKKLLFGRSKHSSLSLSYLSRYVVTFDFRNKGIYLKKGSQFDRADFPDRSGIHILWEKGQVLVESVDIPSRASRAGIKPRDVILRIEGVNASEMSFTRIRRLFGKGEKYRMLIQRDGNELELTLDLCDETKGTGE